MTYFNDKLWAAILADEDTDLYAPAKPKSISAFEAKYGFLLPDAHREFLLRGNGGALGCSRLYGVGRKDYLDLGRNIAEMKPYLEGMADGPLLPFADDWGGDFFCYDLRKPMKPKGYPVLRFNHDYSEPPDEPDKLWSKFAPDFVAFLKKVLKR